MMITASAFHDWLESFGMTAPWVQAWGSLLALTIAIGLAFYNQKQERSRDIKKQARYMEAISLINSEALKAATYVIDEMNSNAVRHHGITTSDLSQCIQALDSITLESLPNAKAYMAIHQFRKDLSTIYWIARNQDDHLVSGISPDVLDDVDEALKRLTKAKGDFEKALLDLR